MRLHFTLLTTVLLAPLVTLHAADAAKPNVLLIISDDQGFGDFGFTGKSTQEE